MAGPVDDVPSNLRPDDPRAPYLQMAEDIRDAIRLGQLKPGDRLPSTRELMDQYQVANMTVQGAVRVLRAQNLVYSVPGRGTFVRSDIAPEDLEASLTAGSPEYVALRRQLEELAGEVRGIQARLNEIEANSLPASKRTGRQR